MLRWFPLSRQSLLLMQLLARKCDRISSISIDYIFAHPFTSLEKRRVQCVCLRIDHSLHPALLYKLESLQAPFFCTRAHNTTLEKVRGGWGEPNQTQPPCESIGWISSHNRALRDGNGWSFFPFISLSWNEGLGGEKLQSFLLGKTLLECRQFISIPWWWLSDGCDHGLWHLSSPLPSNWLI